jgi:hypothetical protein
MDRESRPKLRTEVPLDDGARRVHVPALLIAWRMGRASPRPAISRTM